MAKRGGFPGGKMCIRNSCKYGHSIKDGEMGLTLIKSGTYPNENADIGFHEFTYSIYPHKGRWQEARTVEMAYDPVSYTHLDVYKRQVYGYGKGAGCIPSCCISADVRGICNLQDRG